MKKFRYNFIDNFISCFKLGFAGILSLVFALIPEGIGYGLYNVIDPITEIGRIIAVIDLVSITIPFAVLFAFLSIGLFAIIMTVIE